MKMELWMKMKVRIITVLEIVMIIKMMNHDFDSLSDRMSECNHALSDFRSIPPTVANDPLLALCDEQRSIDCLRPT